MKIGSFSWMRNAWTVRLRLTLWYTLLLSLSFALFSMIVDHFEARSLRGRVDRQLLDTVAAVTSALDRSLEERDGRPTARRLLREIDELGSPPEVALRLSLANGEERFINTRSLPEGLLEALGRTSIGLHEPVTVYDGSHPWRLCAGSGMEDAYRILAARDLAPVDAQLGTLRRTLLIALPLILLGAGGSGYLLAGRALKPVAQMAAQARRIEAAALGQRLEAAASGDEFGRLARVLNDLFARLENSFQQQRRFLSDAAHELRTPAAILRSQADVALERPRSAEEYAETLAVIRAETEHLSEIVDDLLLIARVEAAELPVLRESVDLVEIADDCCRALRPLAERKELALDWRVGEEFAVAGDGRLLRRAVINLLSNAIKYTPVGGKVSVGVRPVSGFVALEVADTGKGLTEEDLPRIFDRFYRGKDRTGETDGAGLGLSIVRTIAELHGGRVEASSRGKGSVFTLFIPADSGCGPEAESEGGASGVLGLEMEEA